MTGAGRPTWPLLRRSATALVPLILLGLFLPLCCCSLYQRVGGDFSSAPPDPLLPALGPEARQLVESAFEGIDPDRLIDLHVHMLTREVHPDWLSWWHPFERMRAQIYLHAAGVELTDTLEKDYEARLVRLARAVERPGTFLLFAMDRFHGPNGSANPDLTTFHVPNETVFEIADRHPGLFRPVASVHPYRDDALEQLDRWAEKGCRFVKWIPSAMGIDPSSPKVLPFYRRMLHHDMVLLTHTGEEQAVEAEEYQGLCNPLLLRTPLDLGLKVVALHAASLGSDPDLDDPQQAERPSFDLFLRLMDEPRYRGILFGEISTAHFHHRVGRPLRILLERDDLHPRLLNGSDYPLPAVNWLVRLDQLAEDGFLEEAHAGPLRELYRLNPLLFDFVLKRSLRHPESGRRFSAELFHLPQELS